jgi:hypothetical protein
VEVGMEIESGRETGVEEIERCGDGNGGRR